MPSAREGKQIMNEDWNGVQLKDTIMYVMVQNPDEHSKNTEPYLMMYVGKFCDKDGMKADVKYESYETGKGGWVFKRFPWLASTKDLFSEKWKVREAN